jgi:hypothetical protein
MLRMLSIAQKTLAAVGGLTVAGAAGIYGMQWVRISYHAHPIRSTICRRWWHFKSKHVYFLFNVFKLTTP